MDASKLQEDNVAKTTECQPTSEVTSEAKPNEGKSVKNNTSEVCNDDSPDIDLSDLEIASPSSDCLNDPELIIPDSINETYKNIITVCSTTTQNIKKSISDFLTSRENVVIEEVDPTTELQESLNKKIADFERVVSGCFTPNDGKPDTTGHEVNPENTCNEDAELEKPTPSVEKVVDKKNVTINASVGDADNDKSEARSKTSPSTVDDKVPLNPGISAGNANSTANLKMQTSTSVKEECKTVATEEDNSSKKQKQSSKKKGEKTIDQIMKSLKCGTDEEKLQALCKKHLEALEELRSSEHKVKQFERQIISQQREKEQLQAEHNRMILAKSRLEGLCREMQRQSKAIKEESLLRIKEEEEKRKEVANKFQTTLNDIIALNQEVSKKNIQLREENAELATKLKSLVDNYEIWEKNMSKVIQQKELETQLAKAKHAKVNLLLKQETEKFLREKQSLLENLSELQKRCTLLTTNELQLRTELGDYTSKYEEFQNVLSNSSKVFASFKTDMETTSKKIKKLEKETNVYKQKWESSNNALLDMISHKEKQDKEFQNAQQRILTLEKLCRALQAERNELQNQISIMNSNSISTSPPEVPEGGVA